MFTLTLYQDLAAGVKKALAGQLEVLLLELLMPPLQYEAHRLQQAMAVSGRLHTYFGGLGLCIFMFVCMNPLWGGLYRVCLSYPRIYIQYVCACVCAQGLGTDEETLLEILCTRSGQDLQEISAAYQDCKS